MESRHSEIIRLADELYANRTKDQSVRDSVAILMSGVAMDYEIEWRLGRAFFFLGQESTDKVSSLHKHLDGIAFCERAVIAEPNRVEGHFWLGVNLALRARRESWAVALVHALRAQRELKTAIRIDHSYHAAGPFRVLGRLQHKLPIWLGGGVARARACYESAINVAQQNTVTRIYFAELLIELREYELARKHLKFVLDVSEDPVWLFEIERDKQRAKELLAKI